MKGINVQVVKSGNEMKNLFTIDEKLGLESPNLTLKPLNGGTILLRNQNNLPIVLKQPPRVNPNVGASHSNLGMMVYVPLMGM